MDLGVLPSKTSVTVTSSVTGANATLPAATESAAGVMSAEQARQLALLYTRHETGQDSTAPLVIQRPAADSVSRGELRAVVSEMQRMVAANASQPVPLIQHDGTLPDRVAVLERMITDYEARISTMAETLDTALAVIEGLGHGQQFLEMHALAKVGVAA